METKKVNNLEKSNYLGKIGVVVAICLSIALLFISIVFLLVVNFAKEWTVNAEKMVLTSNTKIVINLILILIVIIEIFNLTVLIMFVKNKIKSRKLIGFLNLFPLIIPGVLLLIGKKEQEEIMII